MTQRTRLEHDDYGYVLRADGHHVIAANRRSYGPAVAALITGGITFILGCNALVLPLAIEAENPGEKSWLFGIGIGIGLAALLAGSICRMFYRVWRRRSTQAPEACLTVTIRDGEIFDHNEQLLGHVQSAWTSSMIDLVDRSRGITRIVYLHVAGRRFKIFKADSKSGADDVQRLLAEYGVAPKT